MDSGPDATIFLIGVFVVFDKPQPSRRAPPEHRMAGDENDPEPKARLSGFTQGACGVGSDRWCGWTSLGRRQRSA